MKTLVCTAPGNFEYKMAEKPALQKEQAILRIKRIGICGTDLHAFEGTQPFFNYPRILGHELAAELVDMDGNGNFEVGEAVTFIPYFSCGSCIACRTGKSNCCSNIKVCGVHQDGGMTEYLSVPVSTLVKGNGLSFDELALIEPLAIGAHGIARAGVQAGEFVLVMGAGPIGLGVVELARIAGAHVIVIDVNENRLTFCREKLGVHFTINPTVVDVPARLREITHNDMPSVVIDATGNLKAMEQGFHYMAHGARYVLIGLQKNNISFSHPEFHKREATLMSSRNANRSDFEHVLQCMRKGLILPTTYITHRVHFDGIKENFPQWLNPANGVIKAMAEL